MCQVVAGRFADFALLVAIFVALLQLPNGDCKPHQPIRTSNATSDGGDGLFSLSLVHWGDFHARFDSINNASAHCEQPLDDERCFGGYARIVSTVRRLMSEHGRTSDAVLHLNAGDNFQGTFWYNVGRWNVTAQFLNMLPPDAIVSWGGNWSRSLVCVCAAGM